MSHIVLTDAQLQVLLQSQGPLSVLDMRGNLVGHLDPVMFTSQESEAARTAAEKDPRRFSTTQVFAHLLALAEIERHQGTIDPAQLPTLLEQVRSQDHK
jgi:hypothetical protein